jgi:hypothetical protein
MRSQPRPGGIESAHAVDTSAGWGGARAEPYVGMRSAKWRETEGGAREQLAEIVRAATDITTDQAWVSRLHIRALQNVTFEYTIAESRRESLDLCFDSCAHVEGRTVWHMTIGPERVMTPWCSAAVKHALLRKEYKWSLRMPAMGDLTFAMGNFFECSSYVDRSGVPTGLGGPGDRGGESVVDLADSRGMPEIPQSSAISFRQS